MKNGHSTAYLVVKCFRGLANQCAHSPWKNIQGVGNSGLSTAFLNLIKTVIPTKHPSPAELLKLGKEVLSTATGAEGKQHFQRKLLARKQSKNSQLIQHHAQVRFVATSSKMYRNCSNCTEHKFSSSSWDHPKREFLSGQRLVLMSRPIKKWLALSQDKDSQYVRNGRTWRCFPTGAKKTFEQSSIIYLNLPGSQSAVWSLYSYFPVFSKKERSSTTGKVSLLKKLSCTPGNSVLKHGSILKRCSIARLFTPQFTGGT